MSGGDDHTQGANQTHEYDALDGHSTHEGHALIHGAEIGSDHTQHISHATVDEVVVKASVPVTQFVRILTIFAGLGGFLFGYDTGVISGAILYIKDDFDLSALQVETIVSGATAGAMVGALFGAFYMDRSGRKPAILFAAIVFTVGAVVLAIAPGFGVLLVGRLIVGFGIGLASMAVPVYVAEVAPPSHRGALVSTIVLMITSAQFISYLVDSALADVDNGWRWMLGLSAVPAVFQIFGMMGLPESPRYLLSQGKDAEARLVLVQAMGGETGVDDEIADIQRVLQAEAEGSWKQVFSNNMRPMLIIAVGLQALQQFCGINTAMYYSPTIIKMAGFSSNREAILLSDFVAFTNMVFTGVAVYLVDQKGRRRLLLVSLVGITCALALLGGSFVMIGGFGTKQSECSAYSQCSSCALDQDCGWCTSSHTCFRGNSSGPFHHDHGHTIAPCEHDWHYQGGCGGLAKTGGALAVASLVLYVAFFAIGMGAVPWTVMSEIFPLNVRSRANGLATAANWTANLIVSMTFLTLANAVSQAVTFWIYSGICVGTFVFVYVLLPETRGKSLEEITQLFHNRNKVAMARTQ